MSTVDRFDRILYQDLSPETDWTQLGRGSFGCVYKGEYLGLEVAIKEVLPSGEYDVDKYFRRECKILAEARHPNIVQYLGLCLAPPEPPRYDGLAQQQRILIISEYLPRGNLRQYIDDDSLPFPWRLRLSFAIDVTRALAYLHSRHCLHRDLKGENLLCTANERLKVCDFGFARLAAKNDEEQRRMSYCGTDGYMSPEILLGEEFGLPTDIFSLGVIFVEILSRRLVNGKVFQRTMPTFGIDTTEIIERASPGHPSAFLELVLACIQLDPLRRPTALEVLQQLRQIEVSVLEKEAQGMNKTLAGRTGGWSTGGGTLNVGSLSFSGSIKRGLVNHLVERAKDSMNLHRPAGPPRLPSWDGQVQVPSAGSKIKTENSSFVSGGPRVRGVKQWLRADQQSDDDVDEVDLLELANREVVISSHILSSDETSGQPRSRGEMDAADGARTARTAATDWSTITVRAPPALPDSPPSQEYRAPSSLGSIPASWLQQRYAQNFAGPLAAQIIDSTTPSVLDLQAEAGVEEKEQDSVREVYHSTILGHTRDFELARSDDALQSTMASIGGRPHRFSLVKPGLQKILASLLYVQVPSSNPSSGKKGQKMLGVSTNQNQKNIEIKSSVPSAAAPGHLNGSDVCGYCDKGFSAFGWKAFLECDDCAVRCHIKCSDEFDADCRQRPTSPVSSTIFDDTHTI